MKKLHGSINGKQTLHDSMSKIDLNLKTYAITLRLNLFFVFIFSFSNA